MGSPALAQMAPMGVGGPDASSPSAPSDGTVEILHGIRVEDPFRPLEDPSRADVQAWIAAQDRQARALLEGNPVHARVLAFLQASNRYPRMGGLRRVGRSLVSVGVRRHQGAELGSRSATRSPTRAGPCSTPTPWARDGSVSLWSIYPDRLATKVAYLTAENGGDAQVLRIRDIRSGIDLLDRLEGCRWTTRLPGCPTAIPSTTCARRSPPSPRSGTAAATTFSTTSSATRSPPTAWSGASRAGANVMMTLRRSYATNQLMVSAAPGTDEKRGYWVGPLADARLLSMMVPIGLASFWAVPRSILPSAFCRRPITTPRAGASSASSRATRAPAAGRPIVPERRMA